MLRVRAGNTYAMPFVVNLGQRNAEIVNGHLTPLRRILPPTVAFTVIRAKYDLIHSMNAIPLFARVPFIVTFEDWMPRTPPDIRLGFVERLLTRVIASERCVALVAMSQFAKSQMMQQQQRSPHYTTLLAKTEVIYPAVTPGKDRPKRLGNELRLLFVGADFMRKGLPALTTAHIELERRGIPVKTTVVSSLRWTPDDYVGPKSARLVETEKERLGRSTMTVLGSQPNDDVMRLMREHDFLVLPTFHDTFGFVALEAMAMGTPVIATETCAMPEIIGGHNGMLLPFPTDGIGRWQWLYQKRHRDYDYEYMSQIGRMGRLMADNLAAIWNERERYPLMSFAARLTIQNRFNRLQARDELEKLYDRATRVWS
jgi:glycosyltransferase involved in cell wall biosynthesis